jgi:phenylacetate-CoA ligase
MSLDYLYPVEPGRQRIVLNGFALGAWAGGIAFARRAGRRSLVKNTGPDAPKIVQTLLDLGSGGDYLISGYPPFLRRLIETGRATRGFDWKSYRVHLFSGGEGFSEEWRAFMASALREGAKIFSTYGAIDLDVGIALETPLTVAIRRLLESDRELRLELLATDRRPCFLGVYPPLSTHVCEVRGPSGARELAITQLGPHAAAPKVKYNIGDEGGVIPFRTMRDALERTGHDLDRLAGGPDRQPVLPFPFLFMLGRSDGTVSIEGSNIHAADVADAIFSDRELASKVETFKLVVETGPDASPRLCVYVEAREGAPVDDAWTGRCAEKVVAKILETNECFRRSWHEDPAAATPRVVCLPFGAGVFAGEGGRLKHRHIG